VKFKPIPDDIGERVEVDELCESGLRWKDCDKVLPHRRGQRAGSLSARGYWVVSYKGKRYPAHRVIWLLTTGVDPADHEVDHRDMNPSNNKIENLRLATHGQNAGNQNKFRNNRLKYKGITKNGRGYQACIGVKGKQISLGTFDTQEEAAARYNQAALKHHGEFARLNVIESEKTL